MCVKLPLRDLNSNPCIIAPPYRTKTYTYGVIIMLKVCSGLLSSTIVIESVNNYGSDYGCDCGSVLPTFGMGQCIF